MLSRPFIHFVLTAFFAVCSVVAVGQSISGTINSYTGVTSIAGSNVVVATTAGFAAGDIVLIMQMKGASIISTNGATFGDVTNYNCAGCFEYGTIASIAGTTITLQAPPTNSYNTASGSVQLVTVPFYPSPVVTATLTAQPWNGTSGGVIAFESCDTITLNADIDASGDGFRGGSFCTSFFGCNNQNYALGFTSATSCNGGQKGEGIATVPNTQSGGRGHLANGGGGTNPGNSGGGGGGNFGAGGLGGNEYSGCGITGVQGSGAQSLTYTSTVAFMGGGGGGGYRDNNQVAAPGGDGGGIILIGADAIIANGNSILANGDDVTIIANDEGTGGGGAGGTVMLNVSTVIGTLDVETNGGDGGTNNNTIFTTACHGPGGGGGGGLLWVKTATLPTGITHSTTGGTAGLVANAVSSCFNTSFGATDGANGGDQFSLNVVSPGGSATANPIVIPAAPTICAGDTDTLVVTGASAYTWTPATGLNTTTGSTVYATPSATTTYTITAISCDDTATTTVTVTVNPAPASSFSGLNSPYCQDDAAGVALVGSPTGGTFGGAGITGSNFFPNLAGVGTHDITYTVVDGIGCEGTDTIAAEVVPLPTVTISGLNATYCANDAAVTLSGTPTGGTFTGPGVLGTTFDPATVGVGMHEVIYMATDANTCVNYDTFDVEIFVVPVVSFANLLSDYCIDDGGGLLTGTPTGGTFTGPGLVVNSFAPVSAGVGLHQVTYTYSDANACTSFQTQHVTVNPLPTIDFFGLNTTYCIGAGKAFFIPDPVGGIFVGPGISGTSFDATTAGLGVHNVDYTYTDPKGCTSLITKSTEVFPLPDVTFTGLASNYCEDAPVVPLIGEPLSGLFEGAGVSGLNFNPSAAGPGSHLVRYTYTDVNNCSFSAARPVEVHPLPDVQFLPGDDVFCEDADAANVPLSIQGGSLTGPGLVQGLFVPSSVGPGEYTLWYRYTTLKGCSGIDSKQMVVKPLPEVSIAPVERAFCQDQQIVLIGEPVGGTFTGRGMVNDTYDPNVAGRGVHQVIYDYTDAFGCDASDAIALDGACLSLYVPNAFTPDGDGKNDIFLPKGESITLFNLLIFNRWGELVFESNDPAFGWDGLFQGKISQAGIYAWKLDFRLGEEPIQNLTGHVTLIQKER